MILPVEVQIQIFGAHAKFSFSKVFQGAQILIFFDENWQGASLYIKEQTQKYKFEIWILKSTILDPRKLGFWFLKKTPPKKFSLSFGFDSALKTIDTQMLKIYKKNWLTPKKEHFWVFK